MKNPANQAPTTRKSGAPSGPGPENERGADKATQENDLTTGHSTPGDGGNDNARK